MRRSISPVLTHLRSARGEVIDLMLPRHCTIDTIVDFLVNQYDYPRGTRIVHESLSVGPYSVVGDFPDGSLIIELPASTPQCQGAQPLQHPYYSRQPHRESPTRRTQSIQHNEKPYRKVVGSLYPPKPPTFASGARVSGHSLGFSPAGFGTQLECEPVPERKPTGSDARLFPPTAPGPAYTAPPTQQVDSVPVVPEAQRDWRQCGLSDGAWQSPAPEHVLPSPKKASPNVVCNNLENEPDNGAPSGDFWTRRGEQQQPHQEQQQQPSPPRTDVSLRCLSPVLKRSVLLSLPEDTTLDDLLLAAVAQEPRLAGCKPIFRGKQLNNLSTKLSVCGIRSGVGTIEPVPLNPDANGIYSVYFAPNEVNGVQKTMLMEIESNLATIEPMVNREGLTLNQRQGYYEELMRILFRTDGLNDLEDEWRSRRKQVVRRLTELQDSLKVDGAM